MDLMGVVQSSGAGSYMKMTYPTDSNEESLEIDSSGRVYRNSSTARVKKNITNFTLSTQQKESLLNLQLRNFQWRSTNKLDIGLIAEEVDTLTSSSIPELVRFGPDVIYDENGRADFDEEMNPITGSNGLVPSSVNNKALTYLLLEVIKDQQKSIDDLTSRITALE